MTALTLARPEVALKLSQSEDMWIALFTGNKRITIRYGLRDYKVGDVLVIYNEETSWVVKTKITAVHYFTIATIPAKLYKADGFRSRMAMLLGMRKYYPELTKDSDITVIEWELPKGLLVDNNS